MPHKPSDAARANRLFLDTSFDDLDIELGLPVVGKPAVKGVDEKVPFDLPTLSSMQLSRQLQYASGMLSFALVQTAKADNKITAIDAALNRAVSHLRVLLDDGQQKYKLDAEIEEDSRVAALRVKQERAVVESRLHKAMVAAFEARERMFSRELSRRQAETNRGT